MRLGTEARALRHDRAQMQPISQSGEPAPAVFVAVPLRQILPPGPPA